METGVAVLPPHAFVEVGVWEHPVGVSTDVEQDEVFVVLSGSGRVVLGGRPGPAAGSRRRRGARRPGRATTWHVDEPLRKVWITPR